MPPPPDTETPEGKEGEESKKISEEFDEVCFLTIHAEYFAKFFRTKTKKYIVPQVIMVRDFDNSSINSSIPAILTNKVDLADFIYADPKLFAALYPKLEFYRVDYDQDGNIRERLYLFPSEATNNLNYNTLRKLPGIGITGVNFTLAGSNPAAAEKLIDFEVDIDLANAYEFAPYELDNILTKYKNKKAFPFDETDTDNTTTNFLSLLLHPQGKRNEYDGKFYRIKVKVGWQPLDTSFLKDMGYSDEIADRLSVALSKQSMTLMLNLISHNIEVTEEGSISLNIKYQASLEQSTDSGVFDLFYPLSLKKQNYASPDSKISQLKKQQEKTLKAIDNACIGLPESTKKLIREKRQEELNKEIENTQEDQTNDLKQTEVDLKNKIMNYMLDRESKTVWEFTKNVLIEKDTEASTDTNDYSSYSIQVSNKDVENYQNYIKSLNLGVSSATIEAPQFVNIISEVTEDDSVDLLQTTSDIQAQDGKLSSKANKLFSDSVISFGEGILKTFDWVQSASPDYHSTISFVYLYDLICVFYNVLRENIEDYYSGSDESTKQKKDNALRELKEIKVILGDYQDPDSGITVNIGEIPVHLSTFNDWYLNNIGKVDRTNYTLRDFIFSIVNDIIAKSLGAACITGANVEKKISIGFSTYSLEHNVGFEPARQAATSTDESRTSRAGSKNSRPNCYADMGDKPTKQQYKRCLIVDENEPKKNTNYLYVYAKQLPCELDGKDIIKDIENGVYHFFIGQAQGINKSIKFKRIDQPYLKEARATKEDSFVLGQLREVYNLDITLVGNTIFHPGMVIYVHPPIELGVTTDENSFSNLLGIGGYYSVTKVQSSIKVDTFETTLECVYLSAGICDQGKCKPDSELTDIERKELDIAKLEVAKALLENVALTQDSVKEAIYSRSNSVQEKRKALSESVKIYNDYITTRSFQASDLNGVEIATVSVETEKYNAVGGGGIDIQTQLSDEEVIKLQQTLSSISGSIAAREQEARNLTGNGGA